MNSTEAAEIIAVAREGFDRMDARLEAMLAKLADNDGRLDSYDGVVGGLMSGNAETLKRLAEIEARLKRIEERLAFL